jgi:hypothetical protein
MDFALQSRLMIPRFSPFGKFFQDFIAERLKSAL